MNYNFVDIVAELESLIWEMDERFIEDYGRMFLYKTNGVIDIIDCCGIEIFNSETTDLDLYYNEEKDEYLSQEDFIKFVIKEAKKVIGKIFSVLSNIALSQNK